MQNRDKNQHRRGADQRGDKPFLKMIERTRQHIPPWNQFGPGARTIPVAYCRWL